MSTIKKIAQLANVSIGTVDRVIHNRGQVSPETEQRVRRIMKDLNYTTNVFARHLKLAKSFSFGVLMPDPALDEGYWKRSVLGIDRALEELRGQQIDVQYFHFNRYSEGSFDRAADQALQADLDGLLIAPGASEPFHRFIQKIPDLPKSIFSTTITDVDCLSCIGQDAYQSGVMAGKLMRLSVNTGGSIVSIRIQPADEHIQERSNGFQNYFSRYSEFHIAEYEADGNGNSGHFKGVFDQILSDNPDLSGIFMTNVSTHKIAEQIDAAGLAGQIHLVGYDMIQKNVDYLKSGVIDFLISQRPEIQGYQGLYSLYRHVVLKEPVQAKILMQLEIVTLENVDYYHLYGE